MKVIKLTQGLYLGCFASVIDAARAYDRAAVRYHGEFATLNHVKIS